MAQNINRPISPDKTEGHLAYQHRLIAIKEAVLCIGERDMNVTLKVIRNWLKKDEKLKT